jgi:hypothetical protein
MKIKTLGRYAIDMLRGQQQQVEKNQYEEHLDQLRAEQAAQAAQRTTGGYLSPYQNNPYQGMGQQEQLNAHLNAHINAQFDAQKALGALQAQSVSSMYYAGKDEEPPINLEEGAWVAAISELENLWLVKFGSKWVQQPELDEFYKVAVARLIKARKMETHHLTQISLPVYRIIE